MEYFEKTFLVLILRSYMHKVSLKVYAVFCIISVNLK